LNDREKTIRDRAYHLWEAEGRPHGREAEHWERARREFDAAAKPARADQSAGVAPLGGIEPAIDAPPAQRSSAAAKPPTKAASRSAAATADRKPKRISKTRADMGPE
jgi:hypothetical protein